MPTNIYMFFIAGLIPMIIGAIWYNPKVFGNAWMKENNFTPEYAGGGNMLVIFGVSYLFSVMMAFILSSFVIHQGGAFSMMYPEVLESGHAVQNEFNELMGKYGDNSRGFKHGAIHGIMISVFFVLPLFGIISLFERRGWKYIFIHWGYWLVSLILMGGLICSTLKYTPMS